MSERADGTRPEINEDSLDDLLAVVAHELRHPLLALRILASDFLEREQTGQERTLCGKRISDLADHMGRAAEAILDVRQSAGRSDQRPWTGVDLIQCCQTAMDMARPLVQEGVRLGPLRIDSEVQHLTGDAEALRRLVLNLLANAAAHTHAGAIGVQIVQSPDVGGRDGSDFVSVVVSDTGVGMELQALRKLGVPFASDGTRDGCNQGREARYGVGLWLCRNIAALHGGSMWISSTPGVGTSVGVRLRIGLAEPVELQSVPRIRIVSPSQVSRGVISEPATVAPRPEQSVQSPVADDEEPDHGAQEGPASRRLVSTAWVTAFAAMTAVAAQISVPILGTPVPMTLQTVPVLLAPAILGAKLGTLSMLVYILAGVLGLPVFAGGGSGLGVLTGSTGGYLVGFVLAQPVMAWAMGKRRKTTADWRYLFVAMLLAHVAIWLPGVFWLRMTTGMTWSDCLAQGVWPFLPGAFIKSALAAGIAAFYWRWRTAFMPERCQSSL